MRFKRFIEHWQGIFLALIGGVATLWLGVTKQLNLYIHPRYVNFTIIMATLGLLIGVISFRYRLSLQKVETTRLQQLMTFGSVLVCLFAFVSLLIIKPAALTTATANQRGINSSIGAGVQTSSAVPLFGGGDYSKFMVKDWASLLIQTSDPSFYVGKSADVTGFITPDANDPQNVFFVSRFLITCCAVDARPIGVPVYIADWRHQYKADGWVRITGGFAINPSTKSQQHVVIKPATITNVEQPRDPYEY
jgi:uncharacterized repeat protein (TIGR03943 family)